MTEEALRKTSKTGVLSDPNESDSRLNQTVAEHRAIGESASNGHADRTVHFAEDWIRTLESALETRHK